MQDAAAEAALIIDEFAFLDDWEERYQHLISLGRKLPAMDEAMKTEENRLHGCQSVVHFKAEWQQPNLVFHAASDAAIVQGLIALMLRVYSGRTPDDILATEPGFVREIGLDAHLSPTRKNGLAALLTAIREAAANQIEGRS